MVTGLVAASAVSLSACFQDEFPDDENPRRNIVRDAPERAAELDVDTVTRADFRVLGADVSESCEYIAADGEVLLIATPGRAVIRINEVAVKLSASDAGDAPLREGGTFEGPQNIIAVIDRNLGLTDASGIDQRVWPATLNISSDAGELDVQYGKWRCGLKAVRAQ